MKKTIFIAFAAVLTLAGCSKQGLVKDPSKQSDLQAIAFNVQKQNMTKANLEDLKHYNFGVYAWKVGGNSLPDSKVMENYLVGYNGSNFGYAKSANATSTDNSPWFYEGLGTAEYNVAATGFYQPNQSEFMSANTNQYVRYWDLAYAKTNFYCYAPYNKNVTFTKGSATSTMTFGADIIRDGYDNPVNSEYQASTTHAAYDRSLSEFMYAGVQATNANKAKVNVAFKHMGAQLQIRFYEEIPGYKVEIIDLGSDNGSMKSTNTADMAKGIQAAPAKLSGTSYEKDEYYTTQGATVTFTESNAAASYAAKWDGSTKVGTPLMFLVPDNNNGNLTAYSGHNVIKEKTSNGTQEYSYSPTVYYPVSQPTTSVTGLTFHVSYRVIAEDNQETITVHNATVHVPYKANDTFITVWQPNVKYTYTFKFTRDTTGSTDPADEIDATDPTASTKKSLYPIIFESATLADYTTGSVSEYTVSTGTSF